jgi:TolB-like protein/Tfp pilus assembly protein PilF
MLFSLVATTLLDAALSTLFSEFRRRNVFRVAALYLVSAWLIAQVADVVIGLGELPPSMGRVVLVILALGFPVAVALAWFFEWTSEGIRRETAAVVAGSADEPARRHLDYVILSLLLVALAYLATTHDWSGPVPATGASIAVLPFEHRSAQPDDLYFTDGIHEDILTQLGKISSLVVISRTSVMQYRDSGKTIPEIAEELGVATILEGGVQRAGNRVRINLQLIEAATDRHLWAETYDRELSAENVFSIQSEIASSIARTLHARLLPQERQSIETVPTHSLDAYDAYLLGRREMATRRNDELRRARDYFERAVQLDPDFALAYTGLADTLILLSQYGPGEDPATFLAQAEDAASKALQLDPGLGDAHTSFGLVRKFKGDPAEKFAPYLGRGVELAPGSADARKWYANYLAESDREEEALEQLQAAVQLDPMSPIIRVNLAGSLQKAGRHEEARVHLRRALEIDPQFTPAIWELWDNGSVDQLLAAMSRVYRAMGSATDPWIILEFILNYVTLGDDERAEAWAFELDRVAAGSAPTAIAHLNLGLFRSQEAVAVEWARRMLPFERGITMPSRTLLMYDLRRGDFQAAMARYQGRYPELLVDDPQVAALYSVAIDIAMLFQAMGQPERAERLLDRSLAFLATAAAGAVGDFGIFVARVHAMRGNADQAIAALREAIDAGWRLHWWFYLKQDPAFDLLRNDSRFQSIVEELDTEMARQLAKVRELEASGEIVLPPSI